MLDKDFIFKIADEKIEKFKNFNLENFDPLTLDPTYTWIQEDKLNERKKIIFLELNKLITILTKNIKDQKLNAKKLLFNFINKSVQLYFIFMYPNNQFKYLPFSNLTTQQIDRFLLYLIRHEELTTKEGITSEKNLENAHSIFDLYSLNHFLYLIFEELLLNLGESNIRNITNALRKNIRDEVKDFIKMLDENGNVGQTKISNKLKLTILLNKKFEDGFLV